MGARADTFIQRTKKQYADARTQRNIEKLNDDLTEVHSIMTKNIQDVLGQGERLDRECPLPSPACLHYLVPWNSSACMIVLNLLLLLCRHAANVSDAHHRKQTVCRSRKGPVSAGGPLLACMLATLPCPPAHCSAVVRPRERAQLVQTRLSPARCL